MNPYLVVILGILVADYLLDLIADLLNLRSIREELPPEFEGWYDGERYRKSQEYLKDTTRLGIISASILTPLTIAFILFGGFNLADRLARSFQADLIPTGLIFAGILMLLSGGFRLPFSVYRTFVIEEKYGFNRTTPKTFVLDLLKTVLLTAVLGGAVLAAIIWFFEQAGNLAWIWCWGAVVVFQFFFMFISPAVILPLFNKFTPLEPGELRSAIEEYAGGRGFRLRGIYRIDASRRSTKSNAYFTGFGALKRIALFDTLIRKLAPAEVVAVLAHEVGHYRKKHILKMMALSVLTTGLMFFILSRFIDNRGLFAAFRMEQASIYAGLVFFGFLYAPIAMIFSLLAHILSRRWELEADRFAASTCGGPEPFIAALKKLSVDNLSNLSPHPLKVILHYSHPPVLERLRRLIRQSDFS